MAKPSADLWHFVATRPTWKDGLISQDQFRLDSIFDHISEAGHREFIRDASFDASAGLELEPYVLSHQVIARDVCRRQVEQVLAGNSQRQTQLGVVGPVPPGDFREQVSPLG